MSKQIGPHHGPRKATLLPACFAGLLCASIPLALATAQTNTTTTTTTTTSGGQTTVVEETTTTTTQPATTTVVRQPHPLGPAGVGGVARRTARRTTRRLN